MANYSLEVWTGTKRATPLEALQDLEQKLETVDNTKTIRVADISQIGPGKYWQAYAVYDA